MAVKTEVTGQFGPDFGKREHIQTYRRVHDEPIERDFLKKGCLSFGILGFANSRHFGTIYFTPPNFIFFR